MYKNILLAVFRGLHILCRVVLILVIFEVGRASFFGVEALCSEFRLGHKAP